MSRTAKLVLRSVFLLPLLLPGTAWAGRVQLLSKADPAATPPRPVGTAASGVISSDARWVAFAATIPDLAPGQSDGNNRYDTFLLDRATNALTLVSHASGAANLAGNGESFPGGISDDGRYLAFTSSAGNLIAGQVPSVFDNNVFLWDRITGTTTLVSHLPGAPATAIIRDSFVIGLSTDGRFLTFESGVPDLIAGGSDINNGYDIFQWDRITGVTALVSHASSSTTTAGNGETIAASASADGRWVAFGSQATDLVAGGADINGGSDIFLWDRTSGAVTLASHAATSSTTTADAGSAMPRISRDGNWIAFSGEATDLVSGQTGSGTNLFLWSRAAGTTALVTHSPGDPTQALGGLEPTFLAPAYSLSDDGAFVAFRNSADSLVSGQVDGNAQSDVFLYDRSATINTLVSRSTAGAATAGNGSSDAATVSGDGSRVAFLSFGTNLAAGQAGFGRQLFLWNRAGGAVTMVSHAAGAPATSGNGSAYDLATLTADGGLVFYISDASDLTVPADLDEGELDLLLGDTAAGTSTLLSPSPSVASTTPESGVRQVFPRMLSADGRFALFFSQSAHIVPSQVDTNFALDLFLTDRSTGATTLVSHRTGSPVTAATGSCFYTNTCMAAVISADGRWVAFSSNARDLIPDFLHSEFADAPEVYLWDRLTGATVLVSHSQASPVTGSCRVCDQLSISADGRFVAYRNTGIVLYDRDSGANALIGPEGSSDPRISADGGSIVYASTFRFPGQTGPEGNNVFLYNRVTLSTVLVSHSRASWTQGGDGECTSPHPDISADGRYVAYTCLADDLVSGGFDSNHQFDIFLYDRTTAANTLVSHAAASSFMAGAGASFAPWLSADGRWVAFTSAASNLAAGFTDNNDSYDAFLYDRDIGIITLLSYKAAAPTESSAGTSQVADLSADGWTAAILSNSPDLLPGLTDLNATDDLFLFDHGTGRRELASPSLAGPAVTGNGAAYMYPSLSADGSVVLFPSFASDLVAGDRNLSLDVFAYLRGLDYYTLTPCRLLDTRQPQDGPALASGATVTLQPLGLCGIPPTARALSLNLTVLGGTGSGHLLLFPGGTAAPGTSAVNFAAGATRANNAILSLGGDGALAVMPFVSGDGTVHVILDVTGYFQ